MSNITLVNVEASRRMLSICNACRYCEGYCPVFPTLTAQQHLGEDSLNYLANLCHNCTACFHACQYKPPHEFGVNIPVALTNIRQSSYSQYNWPVALAKRYQQTPWLTAVTTVAIIIVVLLATATQHPTLLFSDNAPGAFYAVISHKAMVTWAGLTFSYAAFVLGFSTWRFCQASAIKGKMLMRWRNWLDALKAAASLKHQGGGHADGCNTSDTSFNQHRRIFHQLTMWGFLLCFAATCSATLYEFGLGQLPPYPWLSVPVVLGIIGGVGLLVGPAGLAWLKHHQHHEVVTDVQRDTDYTLLALLFSVSLSGLVLLVARSSIYMPMLLAIHLGFVLSFFILMPYSKFIHGFFRLMALLRFADEQQDQSP